jgi:hypothetical protein
MTWRYVSMKDRNHRSLRIDDDWLGCILGLLILFLVGILPGIIR